MIEIKTCAILSIGTEVVNGYIVDTNTSYLLNRFKHVGISCQGRYFIADDEEMIEKMIFSLREEVDCIVLSGGLGATPDDCTREAVARAIGKPLLIDNEHFEKLKLIYHGWGVLLPEIACKQAMLPENSYPLNNSFGTAVGFAYLWDKTVLAVLPGVPNEMEAMFEQSFLPWLSERVSFTSQFAQRELMVYGITETEVGKKLDYWMRKESNPSVGVYVSKGTIRVVVTAKSITKEKAEELVDLATKEIYKSLSDWIYGENGILLQQMVVQKAIEKNQTFILLEESGTDGLVSASILEFDSSGRNYIAGFIGDVAVYEAKNLQFVKEAISNGVMLIHIQQLPDSDVSCQVNLAIQRRLESMSKVISIPLQMDGIKERITKAVLFEIIRCL